MGLTVGCRTVPFSGGLKDTTWTGRAEKKSAWKNTKPPVLALDQRQCYCLPLTALLSQPGLSPTTQPQQPGHLLNFGWEFKKKQLTAWNKLLISFQLMKSMQATTDKITCSPGHDLSPPFHKEKPWHCFIIITHRLAPPHGARISRVREQNSSTVLMKIHDRSDTHAFADGTE